LDLSFVVILGNNSVLAIEKSGLLRLACRSIRDQKIEHKAAVDDLRADNTAALTELKLNKVK